jgi:hypothetical protein
MMDQELNGDVRTQGILEYSREMIDFGERVPVDTLGSKGVKRK